MNTYFSNFSLSSLQKIIITCMVSYKVAINVLFILSQDINSENHFINFKVFYHG